MFLSAKKEGYFNLKESSTAHWSRTLKGKNGDIKNAQNLVKAIGNLRG